MSKKAKYHHRHRSNSKYNKFLKFVKRNKKTFKKITAALCAALLLIGIGFIVDKNYFHLIKPEPQKTSAKTELEISVPSDEILLVSDAVSYYLTEQKSALSVYKTFEGYKNRLNVGLPLKLNYNVKGISFEEPIKKAVLEISENKTFIESLKYDLDTSMSEVEIYNLKTDTKYYYNLKVTLSYDKELQKKGEFKTAMSPRILNIEGIVNVRDIGGWSVQGDGKIRQGLLFRGSELDGAIEPTYKITANGLEEMRSILGIRFDMDLRASMVNKTPFDAMGKNIKHQYYGIGMYSDILNNDYNEEKIREIFSELADKNNYPIYMHCTYGRDRTGTVIYLLEALLGMSDNDLYRDYEISALTDSYLESEKFVEFTTRINMLSGNTTKEKVEKYLLSIGVTPQEIAKIREIFIEK